MLTNLNSQRPLRFSASYYKNEVNLYDNLLSNLGFSLGTSHSYVFSSDIVRLVEYNW